MGPVIFIKNPSTQYLFGIPSMRRKIREIQVNVDNDWFIGLSFRGYRATKI